MFRALLKVNSYLPHQLLTSENVLQQQLRTTFILKRKGVLKLTRKRQPAKPLRPRHYVYELVKDTNLDKQPNLDVVLKTTVEGVGNAGEKVSVRSRFAYEELLLPGLAVYATPENIEEYKEIIQTDTSNVIRYSSPTASKVLDLLNRTSLDVVMNKDTSWTIQPWHIRASFRKLGWIVPEKAIIMPKQEIKGADMDLEGKIFFVRVLINNTEKAKVKCRLHHWSTTLADRLPFEEYYWKKEDVLVFPEDSESN